MKSPAVRDQGLWQWRAILCFVLSVVLVGIALVPAPRLGAKRDDFPARNGRIRAAEIRDFHGNRRNYHELWIYTFMGESFYRRSPEREPLEFDLARLPAGLPVSIRYCAQSSGREILEVRSDREVLISFEAIMAERRYRTYCVFLAALFFAAAGGGILGWLRWKQPGQRSKPLPAKIAAG